MGLGLGEGEFLPPYYLLPSLAPRSFILPLHPGRVDQAEFCSLIFPGMHFGQELTLTLTPNP
mgnify:FL=1